MRENFVENVHIKRELHGAKARTVKALLKASNETLAPVTPAHMRGVME